MFGSVSVAVDCSRFRFLFMGCAESAELFVLGMQCSEVISAIGTIGTADDETGNGATNEAAAKAAKKANAKRFVLVSASKDRA